MQKKIKKKLEAKKIVCLNTGEEFRSLGSASKKHGITTPNISSCCNGRTKSAGKLNGTRLVWRFKEDFEKLSKKDIELLLTANTSQRRFRRKVICLNNNKTYESITKASNETGIPISSITLCCKGTNRIAGTIDGKKAIWMYVDDYAKLSNKSKESLYNILNRYTNSKVFKNNRDYIEIIESIFNIKKEVLV